MGLGKSNKGFTLAQHGRNLGFTLLELLIVIAIIAVISAFLIFVLNPAETLRKGRDSQRISDLNTINRAVAFYITTSSNPDLDGDGTRGDCGPAATDNVFIGIKDGAPAITDPEVAEKELLPVGATSTTAIDGSGWIPIDFTSIPEGSPVSRLPLDPSYRVANPADVTDNDLLYIYGCDTDTTWELNANLESTNFSQGGEDDRESADGGNNSNVLEVGTKLTILGTSGVGGGGGGDYKAFISSATYTGDLGGLTGGDSKCQTLANAAGLGSVAWMAWLSDSTVSASSRLVHPTSPILRTDGVKIADDWNDLITADPNYLDSIIVKNENGGTLGGRIWTGTNTSGGAEINNCSNWTSVSVVLDGMTGDNGWLTSPWTAEEDISCDNTRRLYCFSQFPL